MQAALEAHFNEVEAQRHEGDEHVAHVRRGADQAGEQTARAVGPDLHHERDAQRPFATHAERRHEAQDHDLPRGRRQAAQPAKDGVGEDAQRHGADAAEAVAEPAEQDAAGRCADEKGGGGPGEPQPDFAVGNGAAGRVGQ